MAALGYKHNRESFRALSTALPYRDLRDLCDGDAEKAYALLMGRAGLLPDSLPENADEESREFLRMLWDYWWRHESSLIHSATLAPEWHTAGVRPQNHPERRIAAAACIFSAGSPLDEILAPSTTIPYWNSRLSLGGKIQKKPIALIGNDRRAAIVTNTIAPFMAACGEDVTSILDKLPPLEFNALTKEMMNALMGGDYNAAKYRHALVQQGLIQIFSDYCLDQRVSCGKCPFAAALRKMGESRTEKTEKRTRRIAQSDEDGLR
jgi:hypothetical protein